MHKVGGTLSSTEQIPLEAVFDSLLINATQRVYVVNASSDSEDSIIFIRKENSSWAKYALFQRRDLSYSLKNFFEVTFYNFPPNNPFQQQQSTRYLICLSIAEQS